MKHNDCTTKLKKWHGPHKPRSRALLHDVRSKQERPAMKTNIKDDIARSDIHSLRNPTDGNRCLADKKNKHENSLTANLFSTTCQKKGEKQRILKSPKNIPTVVCEIDFRRLTSVSRTSFPVRFQRSIILAFRLQHFLCLLR